MPNLITMVLTCIFSRMVLLRRPKPIWFYLFIFFLTREKGKMRSKNRKKRENFSCHRRPTVCMKVPYMLIFLLTTLQMGF